MYLGLSNIEEITKPDIPEKDNVFYELKKFFILAKENNPTIIEYFFIPNNMYRMNSDIWEQIMDRKSLFITTEVRKRFQGYGYNQLKRIKTHRGWMLNPPKKKPERSDYGLPERNKLISSTQMGAFNYLIIKYLEDRCLHHDLRDQLMNMVEYHDFQSMIQSNFYLKEEDTRISFNHIAEDVLNKDLLHVVELEKKYLQALNNWNQYLHWKEYRNPARAILEEKYGMDTKHCSHIFRLLYEAEELLTTGYITFPRPEKDELISIINGKYTYEDLLEFMESINIKFNEMEKNSILPKNIDIKKIEDLLISILINNILV